MAKLRKKTKFMVSVVKSDIKLNESLVKRKVDVEHIHFVDL